MPSPVKCTICEKPIVSDADLYATNCCGAMMHATCLSIRLQTNTKCPQCQEELCPDSSSDYSPSSEESDDHEYSEDANGIDTKADKISATR